MVSPQTLAHLLVISLFSLSGHVLSDYQGEERDALYVLKAEFNNPFLNHNWNGLQCYQNRTDRRWYGIECVNGRVTGISLEGMGLTGKINGQVLFNLTELTHLSFKNNSISGELMDFSANKKLTHIDLSANNFEGPISSSLVGLDLLESLQLQSNRLTGSLPEFRQWSLREFNVSYNNLSGRIPTSGNLQKFGYSSFKGNTGLCGPPTPIACKVGNNQANPPDGDKKQGSLHKSSLIALFVVLDIIAIALAVSLYILYRKKAKKIEKMKGKEFEAENKKMDGGEGKAIVREQEEIGKLSFMENQEDFELGDLLKASAEGLGKGNFGISYKVMMDNGPTVVVKRLRDLRPLTSKEFGKQIRELTDMKHPNLLPILAYYFSKDEKLLVCKFAENGNLYNRIHGGRRNNRIPFKWNSRLLVARDVARALYYLHLNPKSQTTIPHGNLKSSNVLLDENDRALVSDYGLASLIPLSSATQKMVSFKAPEFQDSKNVTKKLDVWSYGCLLLELLTGKISIHSAPQGVNGVDLCSWVHRAVREEWTAEIFDLEIYVQRSAAEGMLRLLQLALRCCEGSPEKRPEMEKVVREVEDIRIKGTEDDDDFSFPSLTEDSLSSNGSGMTGDGEELRRL